MSSVALAVVVGACLSACGSAPHAPSSSGGGSGWALPAGPDGPPIGPSPDPLTVPDAAPRIEPILPSGPNKPYAIAGVSYEPVRADVPMAERGLASWYGRKFHGQRTASGEIYNMHAMTAAHPTMPIPSYARVRNVITGQEVVVRINDRGPFSKGRVIDLSWAAAVKLGVHRGVSTVEVQRLTYADIRSGWPAAGEGAAVGAAVLQEATPATQKARTSGAKGYWLQFGAFSKSDGASTAQRRLAEDLDWLAPLLTVFSEGGLHRVQAGPYVSRDEAAEVAGRVRAASTQVPLLVERR